MYEMITDKVIIVCMTMTRINDVNVTARNQKKE